MIKLYSKESVISAVSSMRRGGRMAHAFLLTGEKGCGKKTVAEYIASALMCENCTDGVPCGKCRHCRRITQGIHPDVIRPERTGKKMIYTKDTMRAVCTDAYTAPNDCDVKVYIFADCESIEENTQNLMLKLIEEPPDTAYFIFTAAEKSIFLPTVLSRVITFGVPECTETECRLALEEKGSFTKEQIDEAVSAYHGNIGRCIEFLENGEAAENVKFCRILASAVLAGDEYTLNKALFSLGENRDRIKSVMALADKVIRDVCIIRLIGDKAELTGCCKDEAFALASKLSFRRAEEIHRALNYTAGCCASNVNAAAAMSALGGILGG